MNKTVHTQENPLGYKSIPELLRSFAIPSIIAMVVSSLYNIVDQIFIGQGVGYLGNAATNVAYPLTTICLAIALLIGIGSASRFSLHLGAGEKDKARRENFLIVLPAAILTVIIFLLITRGGGTAQLGDLTFNIWRVVPYVLVLVGALIGINVFVVLIGGTILSVAVGIATGSLAWDQIFLAIGGNTTINGQEISGVMGMYDITVISIIVACIVSLVKEYGGIHFILQWIHRRIKGEKGAELGIAAGSWDAALFS